MLKRLGLYNVNMKYIRDLAARDSNVLSVSPQLGKETRPFVGIVVVCGSKDYCIPLSSPKPKHCQMKNDKDFSKITDKTGKLIGVLNFNEMIPVHSSLIKRIDIRVKPSDNVSDRYYKGLLNDQLDWCNDNMNAIINKANKLYRIVTETPDKYINLTRRCCNFKKLEEVLEKIVNKEKSAQAQTVTVAKKKTGATFSIKQTKKIAKQISQHQRKVPQKSHDKNKDTR